MNKNRLKVVIKKTDGWHAVSWDYGSPCNLPSRSYMKRMGDNEIKGCYYGLMVGGLGLEGVSKRSNIVVKQWP